MKQLNDQELASLHVKFVVPMVVSQMLQGIEPLDDVAEYTLHDVIGSLEPDTALLCIALCSQHIAAHAAHMPTALALGAKADKIVDEYGPLWLAHESGNTPLDNHTLHQILCHIPEDLESLTKWLGDTGSELDETLAVPAILCDILALQADSHKDCAEYALGHTEEQPHQRPIEQITGAQINGNNVIPFPQPAL